ncbi:hypothetical protein DENSPDRAFT_344521 [Dentipellis sp. KUC8613]|nr:hypothetical protein DENSPDRAFT_344521 [Dentipellis sp. KUC8613]
MPHLRQIKRHPVRRAHIALALIIRPRHRRAQPRRRRATPPASPPPLVRKPHRARGRRLPQRAHLALAQRIDPRMPRPAPLRARRRPGPGPRRLPPSHALVVRRRARRRGGRQRGRRGGRGVGGQRKRGRARRADAVDGRALLAARAPMHEHRRLLAPATLLLAALALVLALVPRIDVDIRRAVRRPALLVLIARAPAALLRALALAAAAALGAPERREAPLERRAGRLERVRGGPDAAPDLARRAPQPLHERARLAAQRLRHARGVAWPVCVWLNFDVDLRLMSVPTI